MEAQNLTEQYLVILGAFVIMSIVMIYFGLLIKKSNPLKIEKTSQNLVEVFFNYFEGVVEGILGAKYVKTFTPLTITIFCTIFLTNISGLIGLAEGAKFNPYYTFTWSISMFLLWNIYGIYKVGIKGFIGEFFAVGVLMAPLELISFFVKPISMGLRLFGNITAGAILMGMVWMVPELLAEISHAAGIVSLPIVMLIGTVLTMVFGLFGPFIQATVFTYLTLVNISTFTQEHE